jgi:type IV pilus assembly protein PilQ
MRTNGKRTKAAVTASIAVVLLAGCASGGPTELLAPRPELVQPEGPLAQSTSPDTVTIDAIEVAQTDDAARIEIQTSEALVWTTYRDESGRLTVELPNSQPGPQVADVEPGAGLVSRVRVTSETSGQRPLTRLLIETVGEAEHSVSAAPGGLTVELGTAVQLAAMDSGVPADAGAAAAPAVEEADLVTQAGEGASWVEEPAAPEAVAETTVWESEPAAAEAPAAQVEVAESVPTHWQDAAPVTSVAAGQAATELLDIDVSRVDGGVIVRLHGDGQFSYQTLSLESPYRYVVDLAGVANFAPQSTYSFSDEPVEQVRVAQFKSQPEMVARVVVDLAYPATPELVGLPDGLALSFGGTAAAAWADTSTLAEDVTAPAPAAVPAAPQVYEAAPSAYEDITYQAEPADEAVLGTYADASLAQEPAPVEEAYEEAAEPAMESMAEDEAPRVEAPAQSVDIQFANPRATATPSSELFNSQTTPQSGDKVYRGEPLTLHLKDADIRDLLRSFSEFSGLNFVIQPGVRGVVTVELTDVPWDQALDLILKTNDLGYDLEGNILRIAPLSKLREEAEQEQQLRAAKAQAVPLATVIRRISYAKADQVARVLQSGSNSILSRRGTVIVDGRTNTLIIKELPNFIDTVIAVIETLDIPEPQVMIEARIIETTKNFSRTLGINWGFDAIASAATGNTTGLVFPNNGTVNGGVNLPQAGNGTLGITLGNVLNTFKLDLALQAAESDGLINILSAPRITTLNNESARIQSGLQIPIQTVANNTVSVQFVNATLSLQVTPHVTAEGTVLMDIDIQKREPLLAFAVVGASNAPIATKDARTRVIVRDGGTTVIGGIYKVTSDEGQDRVPGLSRVPLLKHLFKNNRQSEENEELLIFITPRVVNL